MSLITLTARQYLIKPLRTLSSATLLSALLLQGCAIQTIEEPSTPEPVASEKVEVEERPFEAETLYALLVAEVAGSRERFDVALANYIQQAVKTRDPGVTARATHIARYLELRDAARSMATLWVDITPDDLEARYILGAELIDSDRLIEALPHSVFLLEQQGSTLFQNIAARAVRSTDTQREQLITEYSKLQQLHPKNTEIIIGLGLMLHQQGELDRALVQARNAIALNDQLMAAAVLEAQILNAQNKPAEALKKLSSLLDKHPKNTRLRLQYARLLASIDLDSARLQFEELVKQNPEDEELSFSLALVNKELGRFVEAQEIFESLLQYPKRRSNSHYYLGRIAQQQQQLESALHHYSQVEPGPDFMSSLLQSVEILMTAERQSEASKLLNAARERFPEHSSRLFLIEAEALNKHELFDQAIALLTQALEDDPHNVEILYSRAMTLELLDKLDAMEADLRTIITYQPNNATALNALGYTLANKTDRYDEAFTLIHQALQIKPTDPAVIDSMGWVQYRLGNYSEAILRLRQAMQRMPDHEIAAHLGEVLWVNEQREEALQIWQQGIDLSPDSEIIPATMKRLNAVQP